MSLNTWCPVKNKISLHTFASQNSLYSLPFGAMKIFTALQDYSTYFEPNLPGKWANQSTKGKTHDHPQAEELGLPHMQLEWDSNAYK